MDQQQKVVAYKGFDKDWKCRDFQFEVGKTYVHDGAVEHCKAGFHACEHPLDVFSYYEPNGGRFAVVELAGEMSREKDGDTKIAAGQITIKAELRLPQIIEAAVKYVFDRAKTTKKGTNTQDSGAASATGDSGVAMASGKNGKAMAANGCAIFLVYRDENWNIVHARAAIAGRDVKANTWYALNENGQFAEVE